MGDRRFTRDLDRVRAAGDRAGDRAAAVAELTDEQVVAALAATSTAKERDPYLANVLATESQNRMRRVRTVTAHLGEGVYAVDASGRATFLNPAAERLLGWSAEEVLGRDLRETVHSRSPDGATTRQAEQGLLDPLSEPAAPMSGEGTLVRRDGSLLPVDWTSAPVLVEGETVGAVVVFRDVTERQQRERELARRAAELEAIVHSVHDAVYVGDASGIKIANGRALEMLGFRSLDELNHSIPELSERLNNRDPVTGAKIPADMEPFARALRGESVAQRVLSTNLITGEDVLLRCAAAPIRLEGEVIGAVAVNTRVDGNSSTDP